MSHPVEVMGHRIYVDRNNSLRLTAGKLFEPLETQLVQMLVSQGDTVLDVGANVGYFTLLMARIVGPEGHVYSFEPEAENASILRHNIEENGYNNVTVISKAVTDQTGSSSIYLSESNMGDHRMYASESARKEAAVETVSLDDYFRDRDARISFIKMDIQGAEPIALEGMRELLTSHPDVRFITEFWPYGIDQSGQDARRFLDAMTALGFMCFQIEEEGGATVLKKIIYAGLRAVGVPKRVRSRWFRQLSATRFSSWFELPTGLLRTNTEYLIRRYPPRTQKFTNLLWIRDVRTSTDA